MRNDHERLLDISESIEKIEKYAARGREAFNQDELIQTWIVHHLTILGEAAGNLSQDLRSTFPDVPWPQIVGMRNVLVHGYFDVDRDIVWRVVEKDLPDLKAHVSRMIEKTTPFA